MPEAISAASRQPAFATKRKDRWWVEPLVTGAVLVGFVIYATFRTFENAFYEVGHLLSPFYSPLIETNLAWLSPAVLILWAPAGFRATCYYYRKAYYRSLVFSPPACAVRGVQKNYKGETGVLILQNAHRFLLYIAVVFVFILSYDAIVAFSGGVTVGSLVLTLNALLLGGYTFGCHCWRHLVGGGGNCFSRPGGAPTARYRAWKGSTWLNERHMQFAWASLIWVAFTDLYVRLVASGVWTDARIF